MIYPFQKNRLVFPVTPKLATIAFTIFRPSGNDTGLIPQIIRDANKRKVIADALCERYPNIEQVGFVDLDPKNPELIMTGGEFCGNATSSAAYQILQGKEGNIFIKVSGVTKKLLAGVTKNGEGFSQMPILSETSSVKIDPDYPQNATVTMEGITHYVDFNVDQIKGLTTEEIRAKARRQMIEKGIDDGSACGIIYAEKIHNQWTIYPVVYVRDADTLWYETACGSGTTALGLVLAKRKGRSIKQISVKQPSGLSIAVSVTFDGKTFGYAQIQSNIQKLDEGIIRIPQPISTVSTAKRNFRSLVSRLTH